MNAERYAVKLGGSSIDQPSHIWEFDPVLDMPIAMRILKLSGLGQPIPDAATALGDVLPPELINEEEN